jgi:phosphatidylserine/phosphatidylglycerophosphate/cardiolipin synthase-like enzyme
VKLSGVGVAASGPPPAVLRTLYTFPQADGSVTPLYALVIGAQKTIDMTMYELVDTTFSADLVAACGRGVKVRVVLDQNLEKTSNTAAYKQLNGAPNCSAVWANPVYRATHQKTITVDGSVSAILSLYLTSRYYKTTRDFGLVENDPADVAAIEATFNQDYVAAAVSPGSGDDLIWSPTTAQAALLGIVNGATKTLLVENEEMSASNIVSALEAAAKRGVAVNIAMTDNTSYATQFAALKAAGCGVHVYPNTTTALYIHAKALVADYGLSTQKIYMGSINFSIASMTGNRELGLYITDAAAAQSLNATIASDYAGAPSF